MSWRDESEMNTYKLQSLVAEQREVFDCVGGLVQAVGQNASYKLAVNQRHCGQTQSLRQDRLLRSEDGGDKLSNTWGTVGKQQFISCVTVSYFGRKCLADPPFACLLWHPAVLRGCIGGLQPSVVHGPRRPLGKQTHLWDEGIGHEI